MLKTENKIEMEHMITIFLQMKVKDFKIKKLETPEDYNYINSEIYKAANIMVQIFFENIPIIEIPRAIKNIKKTLREGKKILPKMNLHGQFIDKSMDLYLHRIQEIYSQYGQS